MSFRNVKELFQGINTDNIEALLKQEKEDKEEEEKLVKEEETEIDIEEDQ